METKRRQKSLPSAARVDVLFTRWREERLRKSNPAVTTAHQAFKRSHLDTIADHLFSERPGFGTLVSTVRSDAGATSAIRHLLTPPTDKSCRASGRVGFAAPPLRLPLDSLRSNPFIFFFLRKKRVREDLVTSPPEATRWGNVIDVCHQEKRPPRAEEILQRELPADSTVEKCAGQAPLQEEFEPRVVRPELASDVRTHVTRVSA